MNRSVRSKRVHLSCVSLENICFTFAGSRSDRWGLTDVSPPPPPRPPHPPHPFLSSLVMAWSSNYSFGPQEHDFVSWFSSRANAGAAAGEVLISAPALLVIRSTSLRVGEHFPPPQAAGNIYAGFCVASAESCSHLYGSQYRGLKCLFFVSIWIWNDSYESILCLFLEAKRSSFGFSVRFLG